MSRVEVATVTTSVITVPGFVLVTVNCGAKVTGEFGAKLGSEQLIEPVVVQVQPEGIVPMLARLVLAGKASVKVALAQLLGPLLVTTWL